MLSGLEIHRRRKKNNIWQNVKQLENINDSGRKRINLMKPWWPTRDCATIPSEEKHSLSYLSFYFQLPVRNTSIYGVVNRLINQYPVGRSRSLKARKYKNKM